MQSRSFPRFTRLPRHAQLARGAKGASARREAGVSNAPMSNVHGSIAATSMYAQHALRPPSRQEVYRLCLVSVGLAVLCLALLALAVI